MSNHSLPLFNLCIACFFILSLRGLTFPQKAYRSNLLGILGICLAIIMSLTSGTHQFLALSAIVIGAVIGIYISQKIKLTGLPQAVAAFNGLGGLSAFLISCSALLEDHLDIIDTPVSAAVGIFTFSGSFIAFSKLQGLIKTNSHQISLTMNLCIFVILILAFIGYIIHPKLSYFCILSFFALLLGITITLRIGGADMPIIIALLNAATGLNSAIIGFVINNTLLIITGALIGVSGTILAYIMCLAMHRSLLTVLLGKTAIRSKENSFNSNKIVKVASPADAAFIMENARKVIIIPGYGMAVAQAQHILKQMAMLLTDKYHVEVKFAIHPVAGRMPGHMNVLLAEADIPYEQIYALNDINNEFSATDVAYVIGANDIINPLAKTDSSSAIYGMPILDVAQAKTILIVKRSLASGYTGLDNPLFYADNTLMLFGDAQKITAEIVKNLEH